jgi:hypothetical protein
MSDFPAMEYRPSDDGQIELAPGETSLSFLQRVYRSVTQPMSRRMQAAMAALPHEHPKLGAITTLSLSGQDYATLLDRAIERSGKTAEVRQIEHQHSPAQGNEDPD